MVASKEAPPQAEFIDRVVSALRKVPAIELSPEQEAAVLAGQEQVRRKERQVIVEQLASERASQLLAVAASPQTPVIRTREAIEYFFKVKELKKDSTKKTYQKRLNQYADKFEFLPVEEEEDRLREYLRFEDPETHKSGSPKYRVGQQSLLNLFYETIKPHFHLPYNPVAKWERPDVGSPTPNPMSLSQATALMRVVETDTELAALHHQLGAGWRPVEFRRIEALDVRKALSREHPIIFCHGKERDEDTPTLPEALKVLARLTPATLGGKSVV